MKKISLLVLSATFLSSSASAQELKPYVGIGVQATTLAYKESDAKRIYERNFVAPNIFAGVSFSENFSAEIGFSKSREEDRENRANAGGTIRTKSDVTTYNIDAIYSPKIDNNLKFLMIGSVARVELDAKYENIGDDFTIASNSSGSGYGYGAGVGLEGELCKNVALRATTKLMKVSGLGGVERMFVYNVGLKFGF